MKVCSHQAHKNSPNLTDSPNYSLTLLFERGGRLGNNNNDDDQRGSLGGGGGRGRGTSSREGRSPS